MELDFEALLNKASRSHSILRRLLLIWLRPSFIFFDQESLIFAQTPDLGQQHPGV